MNRRQFFSLGVVTLLPIGVVSEQLKPLVSQTPRSFRDPKFSIGQWVRRDYTATDETTGNENCFFDIGEVRGMEYSPNNWVLQGWVYFVHWGILESKPVNFIGHEPVHESDLVTSLRAKL